MCTKIMGILNVTPDSFSDGGRYLDPQKALNHAQRMIEEGADIIDIGGESTRPGSDAVPIEEELARILPVVKRLSPPANVTLSIDTRRPEIAERALAHGVNFINDVSGFSNQRMRKIAAESGATCCVMHMLGEPKTMQKNPHYPRGILAELLHWFSVRIDLLLSDGVDPEQIILDPGIGFGKSLEDNLLILRNLSSLKALGFPLLLGASRKSFMTAISGLPSTELGAGNAAVSALAVASGIDILRVHDVKETKLACAVAKRVVA